MAMSLKIDDALKNRIQRLVRQRRLPAHWLMLDALQQYVEREEARESFKQEALSSWDSYLKTGRHLTGEEVRAWLDSWDCDSNETLIACHQ